MKVIKLQITKNFYHIGRYTWLVDPLQRSVQVQVL